MMKKRVMALICAAVMVVGMTMTAVAADSVQASVVTGVSSAVDKNNNSVNIKVVAADESNQAVTEIKTEVNWTQELKNQNVYEDGLKLIDVKEVVIEGDASLVTFPVTITFTATGIKSGDKVVVLHYLTDEKKWETVSATAGDGTITATFNSLSPVAYFKVADTTTTSPSTGEPMTAMLAIAAVAIGAAGLAISSKKRA